MLLIYVNCIRNFFLLPFLSAALHIFKKETFTLPVHLLCYFSLLYSIPCLYSVRVYLPTPPVIDSLIVPTLG